MKDSDKITAPSLRDSFGRDITYLRLSVTDRCDFRCQYCMSEDMTFLPRKDVMTLEEMVEISDIFIARGVKKIRLSGGEPLVRKDIMTLINALGERISTDGLEELTITTNGSQLTKFAAQLYKAGVRRLNVSLDTLNPDEFTRITRRGQLDKVLAGIKAASDAGLAIKINMVALKGTNQDDIPKMLEWCVQNGHDLSLIETMPMGPIDGDRRDTYLPLTAVVPALVDRFNLIPSTWKTGGPSRYHDVPGTETRLGIISPLSNNFCSSCNRVRLTCTGRIYMCLGQDDHIDVRAALRDDPSGKSVNKLLDKAMLTKPKAHDFAIGDIRNTEVSRHMSTTGG